MAIALGDLAVRFGCELRGDPATEVETVGSLENAGPRSLTFLANPKYRQFLESTTASCVILRPENADACPVSALLHDDPYRIYALIATFLHPPPAVRPGINDSANVAATAIVPSSAQIDANASIGERAVIGERVIVGASAAIGNDASIGDDTRVFANATLYSGVVIGQRCRIHSGAVIGADGFGNAPSPEGWLPVPQLGTVRIGDDVDVGANTCIDRGAIGDTIIEDGVKLDNLVQIAHNVRIGAHTAMAAQVGISGSAVIGRHCLFAGHSGTVGHIVVCDNVVVSGKTMITKNIDEPGQYGAAMPAQKMKDYRRTIARVRQLDKIVARLATLEKTLKREPTDD